MTDTELKIELRCSKCNSKQIRTTKKYRVCNHCGYREEYSEDIE